MNVSTPTVVPEIPHLGYGPGRRAPHPFDRNGFSNPEVSDTMAHYVIDVHHHTHTCPTTASPHIVATRRTIVSVATGGPCTRPVTVRTRTGPVVVSCARAVQAAQQCPACRVTITVRHTTTIELGPVALTTTIAATGKLKDPCPACGLPVSAMLADTGRHLLCPTPAWVGVR